MLRALLTTLALLLDDAGAGAGGDLVPWHVAVLVEGFHRCGGTIVHERWVLTVALCTAHREALPLAVRVGARHSDSGGQLHRVEKAVTHPHFVADTNNDVGLLKLSGPLQLGGALRKLALPPGRLAPLPLFLVDVSWARSSHHRGRRGVAQVTVHVLKFRRCLKSFPEVKPDEGLQLCGRAVSTPWRWCQAESGGSLSDGKVLYGVVSYGDEGCGYDPVVYTRVSAFTDWIRETIGL